MLFPDSEMNAIKTTITATNALSEGISLDGCDMTVTRTEQSIAMSFLLVIKQIELRSPDVTRLGLNVVA